MDNKFLILKKKFPSLKKNVSMKSCTTFKIGGEAEYFLVAKSKKEVLDAIKIAKKLGVEIFFLGGGSNLIVLDNGVKGLVIKNKIEKPILLKKDNIVEAPTGAVLGKVVDFAIKNSLKGVEWAGGLPGTFGGAIRGNAGAFGGEIKDSVFYVEALDNNLKLRKLNNKECDFSYRSSIFKEKNWTILSARIKLVKGDKKELGKIAKSRIEYRKEKHPLEYPNAGSVFKNVSFEKVPEKFKDIFKDKVKQDPFPIVPAAWFIIGAELSGRKIGGAQISKKHSNYIVNLGGASAQDVLSLIDLAKSEVNKKYGIILETEVQIIAY